MILFEWDAQKESLENVRTSVCFRILSSSLTSVSVFSVCCYSIVSISVVGTAANKYVILILTTFSSGSGYRRMDMTQIGYRSLPSMGLCGFGAKMTPDKESLRCMLLLKPGYI
jgi:hypothetical protein